MVRLYSGSIINSQQLNMPKFIYSAFELSDFGFFKRPAIQELCIFASSETVKRSMAGQKTCLEYQNMVCYAYVTNTGLAATCVTDADYPVRIAYEFILNILKKYASSQSESDIDKLLQDYQDITKVDKLAAIKSELDATTKICSDTINKLMIRDDEMQDLLKKTEELSEITKKFVDTTDDLNKCCQLF